MAKTVAQNNLNADPFLLHSEDDVDLEDEEEQLSDISDEDMIEYEEEFESEDNDNADIELTTHNLLVSSSGQTWSKIPPFNHAGQTPRRNVKCHRLGITAYGAHRVCDELSSFKAIFDNEMIETILVETNREGQRIKSDFVKFTVTDIHAYLGLCILRGVYKGSNESLEELWSQDHGRKVFRDTMPLYKFTSIKRFLRFDNPATRNARLQRDKLAAVRLLLDGFVSNTKKCYMPAYNVTVDEQLYPYRGRCRYKQYMPSKPAKYGLKYWVLCEASTSYCFVILYTGKDERREISLGQHVCEQLLQDLRGSAPGLTVDNFFCSLNLARKLLQWNITLVGTLRLNRKEIPQECKNPLGKDLYSSEFLYTTEDRIQLVAYKAKSKKVNFIFNLFIMSSFNIHTQMVLMLSSEHSSPQIMSGDFENPIGDDYFCYH